MANRRMRSEFAGQDGPSGVVPLLKRQDRLSAHERIVLMNLTGTENPMAPLNRRAWIGSGWIDPIIPPSRIPPIQ